jgi:hypothetical protein
MNTNNNQNESCESCMMPFSKDTGVRESDRYCSYCFKDGKLCYEGTDDLIDSWVLKESQNFCLIYLNKYKNLDLEIEKNENYKQNLSMLDIVLSNY